MAQARWGEVDRMARSVIAAHLEVPRDSFEITFEWQRSHTAP